MSKDLLKNLLKHINVNLRISHFILQHLLSKYSKTDYKIFLKTNNAQFNNLAFEIIIIK